MRLGCRRCGFCALLKSRTGLRTDWEAVADDEVAVVGEMGDCVVDVGGVELFFLEIFPELIAGFGVGLLCGLRPVRREARGDGVDDCQTELAFVDLE